MGNFHSFSTSSDNGNDPERERQLAIQLHQETRAIYKPSYVSSDMASEMFASHDPSTVDTIVDGIAMSAEQAKTLYEKCLITRDQYARGIEAGMQRVGNKGWKVREDRTPSARPSAASIIRATLRRKR